RTNRVSERMFANAQLRFGLVLLALLSLLLHVHSSFVPKGRLICDVLDYNLNHLLCRTGRKCRLQEQHCDIMHPDKQCCPGTSCGIRNINNNMVNICLMCRDIGQPCGPDKGSCCRGLRCQKITQFASVCNPVDYKFFADFESKGNVQGL